MIKVFGIGNILLCDDGIGVRVLEKLLPTIHSLSPQIEGIIGETNALFCIDCLNADDFVIIIDSTYLNLNPGTISYIPFSECERFITNPSASHQMTLLRLLKLEYPNIKGYLIGIEIERIDFSLDLSDVLEECFEAICTEILQFLKKVVNAHA